jgi:broad specificity phosphatase PhoE
VRLPRACVAGSGGGRYGIAPHLTRLQLVRHGETVWNHEGRYQGQTDVPLSDTGRAQARLLGARLADEPFAAAYASDLARCRETAEIVLADRDLPLTCLPALREVHLGEWEGLTEADLRRTRSEELAGVRADPAGYAPPGGENRLELQERMVGALEGVVARHADGQLLVVSHGGALRAFVAWVLQADLRANWRLQLDNCAISVVDWGAGGPLLIRWNDTAHLTATTGPPLHRHRAE